ncbi:MAG: phage protein GemA/Gp16 family protein [Candidatus Omnitrophota bacterium]|nr:regulatory protein GemA [Candidatus Omnitrophota bacterium]
MIDKNKLAVVHIVKKELALPDATYRKILKTAAGVTSSKDLDDEKFRKLMNYFVRSKYYHINPRGLTIRQKLLITSLAEQLLWEEGHLKNFVHKYYHKNTVEQLTKKEAIKLIEALKSILGRNNEANALYLTKRKRKR